jgi:hypothetical protein
MGRYYSSKKEEADDLKKIETWWLRKHGYLVPDLVSKHGGIEWKYGNSGTSHNISISTCTATGNGWSPHLRLMYTQTDRNTEEKKEFDYKFSLVSTPCRFGGLRWWFICPLSKNGVYCGKRVGVVYKSGDHFGCRHCYELSYESRNQNRRGRFMPLFETLRTEKKMEDVEATMKRRYYAGRPTKKMRRVITLSRRAQRLLPFLTDL